MKDESFQMKTHLLRPITRGVLVNTVEKLVKNISTVWYMRLGYMKERSLQELHGCLLRLSSSANLISTSTMRKHHKVSLTTTIHEM